MGAIAVIATLVYLARQIKQANTSTHRQMYAQAATAISEYWLNLAKEPELHTLFQTLLTTPDALDRADQERAFLVLDAYLSLMESYYLHNLEFEEKQSQERWRRILVRLLSTPGGQIYWQKRRFAFHTLFGDYLETILHSEEQGI